MAPGDRMTNDAAFDAIVSDRSDDPCAVLGCHLVMVDGLAALVFRTLQLAWPWSTCIVPIDLAASSARSRTAYPLP